MKIDNINKYDEFMIDNVDENLIIEEEKSDIDVAFITLCNDGYVNYTLNCIESLKRIKSKLKITCYCIGTHSYNILKESGVNVISLDSKLSEFESYYSNNWTDITYIKLKIIHDNLLKHDYVLYTDGDVVFEKREFFNYIINIISNYDIVCQTEFGSKSSSICSGFMFIKSNTETLKLFDAHTTIIKGISYICNKEEDIQEKDDQNYIDKYLKKNSNIKLKKLSNILFPNGNFYYNNVDKIEPYIIHFNWAIGHDKKKLMQKYGKIYTLT